MEGLIALIFFIYIPGVVVLVRNIFQDTYFWQIKEYRVDRVLSSLRYREEPTQRNKILNILQYGLFAGSIIFFLQPVNILLIIPILAFGSYWIESLNVLQAFTAKKLIRPKKSLRNLLIAIITLVVLLLPVLLPIHLVTSLYHENQITNTPVTINSKQVNFSDFLLHKNQAGGENAEVVEIPLVIAVAMITCFLILSADLATSLVVSIAAIITEPLAQIKRRRLISQAKKKVSRHTGFKVVAITGSYGKSTTKEILYELIKDNFKTAKTRENYNSPVGLAQEVMVNLENNTEVFIAEMGAYKKGEISRSCDILKPDVSIVTAVAPQHLSLFGSLGNIVKAKYEIIEKLKSDGLAIFNGNNQYCLEMATKSKKRELIYFTIGEDSEENKLLNKTTQSLGDQSGVLAGKVSGHLSASNIFKQDHSYKFKLNYNKVSLPVTVKVTGQHNISNILAAIGAALELGMDFKSIAAKLQVISLPQIHLVWRKGINNTQILDDGYNSNIDGFKEAIKTINEKNNGKKVIVVTKGLIELKDMKKELYKGLVDLIYANTDVIISSDKDLLNMVDGPEKKNKNVMTVFAKEPEEFFNAIVANSSEGDLILLEGALAPKLLNEIIVH